MTRISAQNRVPRHEARQTATGPANKAWHRPWAGLPSSHPILRLLVVCVQKEANARARSSGCTRGSSAVVDAAVNALTLSSSCTAGTHGCHRDLVRRQEIYERLPPDARTAGSSRSSCVQRGAFQGDHITTTCMHSQPRPETACRATRTPRTPSARHSTAPRHQRPSSLPPSRPSAQEARTEPGANRARTGRGPGSNRF